jgi:hypothetical protein
MSCPKCYSTMVEVDDVGDGNRGEECVVCGYTISDCETPCPKGVDNEPCFPVDGPHGETICLMCERDM